MTSKPDAASAPYEADFADASARYGLPDGLLREVARQESGFNPGSKSSAGAQGIMQFEPDTAAGLGVDPWDPASAIDGAGRYLAQLHTQFGSWDLALAGYNAGAGAVAKYGNTVPPYAETQDYVRIIFGKLGWKLPAGAGVPKATAPGTTGGDVTASPSPSTASSSGAGLSGWERVIVQGVLLIGGVGLVVAGIYQTTTGRSAAGAVGGQIASVGAQAKSAAAALGKDAAVVAA